MVPASEPPSIWFHPVRTNVRERIEQCLGAGHENPGLRREQLEGPLAICVEQELKCEGILDYVGNAQGHQTSPKCARLAPFDLPIRRFSVARRIQLGTRHSSSHRPRSRLPALTVKETSDEEEIQFIRTATGSLQPRAR